ncbi:MAG: V-type ATP synthase subunit I [Candidatus Eisenbacteria bacterium]
MSLTPMQKVAVFFPLEERDNLLSLLQDRGAVQILDLKETPIGKDLELAEAGGTSDAERIVADLKGAIDDVSEFGEKGGFLSALSGGKVIVDTRKFTETINDFDYAGVVKQIDELEVERAEIRARRHHFENTIAQLRPWRALDVPLEELVPGEEAGIVAGAVSGRSPAALGSVLAGETDTAEIETVSETERESCVVVFYHRFEEDKVQEVLRRNDFEAVTFEDLKGLPHELIVDAENQMAPLDEKMEQLAVMGAELAGHKPTLMIVHDYFAEEAQKIRAQSLVGTTRKAGMIQGWIRAAQYEKLTSDIESKITAAEVTRIEPEKDEEPPIELKNRRLVKPFEVITEMYGMPHSKEVDPTPLAAPFFALFFGICITDAGYGLVLIALSLFLMKYLQTARKFLWLIFAGGVMTVLMGAVTGGWFGITDDVLPSWLGFVGSFRHALMQFDPMRQPMVMFALAIGLGFIQVTFGLLIEMIENFRKKDIMAGIFEQITWIVLIWGAALFGAGKMGYLPEAYVPGFKTAAIVAALGIVGFTNRVSKNPAVRIGSGIYRLYGATGFLGDILSYTRLLALGLATGGIAMVINLVALMARDIPIIGWPAMVVVLVGGHTFNIAVNALGGFVHSARLQYVEFYPKFFEGGGKPFKPFKRDLKYTRLVGGSS